ncbi:hypothetical protein [Halomarina rubra]|uniref:Uncharacterized protein n=1 Tax=Halomarina rubra TaxID=2071873 RepID=A0ABD6AXM5_9EURY|nr:hypothetical protein [Halomarina rubra]
MGLRTSFDILARVVEEFESRGQSVRDLEVRTVDAGTGRLEATLQLPVSFCPAPDASRGVTLEPRAATPTETAGVSIEFSTPVLDELDDELADAVSASVEETVVTGADVVLTVALRVDPADVGTPEQPGGVSADRVADAVEPAAPEQTPSVETAVEGESDETEPNAETGDGDTTVSAGPPTHDDPLVERLEAVRDESRPPYEDTPFLQELYTSCDTFAEMNRYLGMDVSTETVRRYMIDAGVHTAASYATRDGDGPENTRRPAEDAATNGTDLDAASARLHPHDVEAVARRLPEGVTVDDLVDAVLASATVYQVQRRLDLDRRTTKRLLDDLDLLEFVLHRIGGEHRREYSTEDLLERIERSSAPANDDPSVV